MSDDNLSIGMKADAPPSKPGIELDEASGKDMVEHAQRAVHAFGRLMLVMGRTLTSGEHHPDQIKLGFDYGVSMAYVEVDMAGIAAAARDQLETEGLAALLDSITVDYGRYHVHPQPDPATPAPRPTYASAPVSTVRLYLHSTGV